MNIYYRYAMPKEKNLFLKNNDIFDGLVIPAHIALDQMDSLPSWISINDINYFIDPVTYVLVEPNAKIHNKKFKVRRSYKKLIKHLNLDQDEIDFVYDVLPTEYFFQGKEFDEDKVNNFVDLFLRVQFKVKELEQDIKEMIDFFKENEEVDYPISLLLESGNNPLFYTAPGFFFDSIDDDEFKLNIKFMEIAAHLTEDSECYGYLPIGKDFIKSDSDISKLIESIPDNIHGLLLWFEDFDDTKASESQLKLMVELVSELSAEGYNVINLYGGFFSVLLGAVGLSGFSSGLCYDTYRSRIIEIGGGPIPFRYFVPEINKFLTGNKTESIYHVIEPKCICSQCTQRKEQYNLEGQNNIDDFINSYFDYQTNNDYASLEQDLKEHFMYSISHEIDALKEKGVKEYLEEKEKLYLHLKDKIGVIADEYAGHLPRWKKALDGHY